MRPETDPSGLLIDFQRMCLPSRLPPGPGLTARGPSSTLSRLHPSAPWPWRPRPSRGPGSAGLCAVLVNAPPTPGLEMVENPQGCPPAYQAEDTNPYPDLLASAWMAPAAEVSSLWLHPMQWPVQLPAGLRPAFLVSGPARSRPG